MSEYRWNEKNSTFTWLSSLYNAFGLSSKYQNDKMSKYHNQVRISMEKPSTIQGFETGDPWLNNKHTSFTKFMFFFFMHLNFLFEYNNIIFQFLIFTFRPMPLMTSLFHIKITVSVRKSLNQDLDPYYLKLPMLFLYRHSSAGK